MATETLKKLNYKYNTLIDVDNLAGRRRYGGFFGNGGHSADSPPLMIALFVVLVTLSYAVRGAIVAFMDFGITIMTMSD